MATRGAVDGRFGQPGCARGCSAKRGPGSWPRRSWPGKEGNSAMEECGKEGLLLCCTLGLGSGGAGVCSGQGGGVSGSSEMCEARPARGAGLGCGSQGGNGLGAMRGAGLSWAAADGREKRKWGIIRI